MAHDGGPKSQRLKKRLQHHGGPMLSVEASRGSWVHTIWGSFQDWLILLPKNRLYIYKMLGVYFNLLLSSSPCDENCVFMLVGPRQAFWIRGAPTWRELVVGGGPYNDGVFSQGCFYIQNKQFNVTVINAQHVLSAMKAKDTGMEIRTRSLRIKLLDEPVARVRQRYMVQSCNDVLLVRQYFSSQLETKHIDVYRLDIYQEAWVKVESLGDRVLFIGRNCSTSYSVEELGIGMANCIFFNLQYDIVSGSKTDEWGIFNLDKQDVKSFASRPSSRMVEATWLSAPAWWYSTSSRGIAMRRQLKRSSGVGREKTPQN